MDNSLSEEILKYVEEHDMDFNTANAILSMIFALYSDNPSIELAKAKHFLERRTAVVNKRIGNKSYTKKIWVKPVQNGGK